MSDGDVFADVHAEAYGTFADVHREAYGRPRRRSRADVAATGARRRARKPVAPYHVTGDARILHDCGHYVYTESHYGGPPTFPASCWYCQKPVAV